jgi:hypothetical protein
MKICISEKSSRLLRTSSIKPHRLGAVQPELWLYLSHVVHVWNKKRSQRIRLYGLLASPMQYKNDYDAKERCKAYSGYPLIKRLHQKVVGLCAFCRKPNIKKPLSMKKTSRPAASTQKRCFSGVSPLKIPIVWQRQLTQLSHVK